MILLPSDDLSTNFDESENSDNALKHTRIRQIVAFQPLLQFIRMSTPSPLSNSSPDEKEFKVSRSMHPGPLEISRGPIS